MNAVVLLAMQLASHDADASTNSVKWLKRHVVSHYDHLELTNAMVLLMILSVSCDAMIQNNDTISVMLHLVQVILI